LLGTNAATNVLANAEALADYLAGDVSTCIVPVGQTAKANCGSTIAVGNPERWVVVNAYNFYFQDSWQATKKLNLNFGMRYEYFGPLHSSKKDIAVFIPGKGMVIQGKQLRSANRIRLSSDIERRSRRAWRNRRLLRSDQYEPVPGFPPAHYCITGHRGQRFWTVSRLHI
jgi:hypothetical protein